MTKISFAITNDTNPSSIRQLLENIKGVLVGSISIETDKKAEADYINTIQQETAETARHNDYMKKLHQLVSSIDKSAIDHNDEKTRYILSK